MKRFGSRKIIEYIILISLTIYGIRAGVCVLQVTILGLSDKVPQHVFENPFWKS
jgi:hypothetical protein